MRVEARIEKARVAATKRREGGSSTARTSDAPVATKGVTVQVVGVPGTLEARGKPGANTGSLQAEVARNATSLTYLIPALVTKDGELRCRDQHIEIASRYIFPVAYAISLAAYFSDKS